MLYKNGLEVLEQIVLYTDYYERSNEHNQGRRLSLWYSLICACLILFTSYLI